MDQFGQFGFDLCEAASGAFPLTDEQRENTIKILRAGSMGEFSDVYEPLETYTDAELCSKAISICVDFCRDKGLI